MIIGEPALLTLGGEVDFATTAQLRAGARALAGSWRWEDGSIAMVDVTEVTFADLAAVAMLAKLAAARQIAGGRLLIIGAAAHLTQVLDISDVLPAVDTLP